MIKTYEEFKSYYKRYGKTPNMLSKAKHALNDKELQTKWKSYEKANAKQIESRKVQKGTKGDPLWDALSLSVRKRDGECQLLKKVKEDVSKLEAFKYLINSSPLDLINTLDLAHIIPRSKSSKLYYDAQNLILLNRVSHSYLDSYCCPLTGKAISKTEWKQWWVYIIGQERWDALNSKE